MTEVRFYQLQRQSLDQVLPVLVSRTLERGWKAVIETTGPERLSAIDDALWTFSDDSFLPHAPASEADPAADPVVLIEGPGNPIGATVRFLVDGAPLPGDIASYELVVVVFDGNDEEALAGAREQWRAVKSSGHDATYWQQDADGRWDKKA